MHIERELSGVVDENVDDLSFYKAVGCEKCGNTGYIGRIGVHEVLVMNEQLNPLILNKVSAQEIDQKARELGMVSIVQDALIKSVMGETSIEESLQLI